MQTVLMTNAGHRIPRVYQLQPFGGYLSEFREFGGYRLPTRIEAGNFLARMLIFRSLG